MRAFAVSAVVLSVCNPGPADSDPTQAPTFACENMFDDDCRYEADVEFDEATLQVAQMIFDTAGAWDAAAIEDIVGSVTIRDRDGVHPTISCTFDANIVFNVATVGTEVTASAVSNATFDEACPLDCPWFLPGGGTFHRDEGRFGLGYFEGQFTMEWGPTDDLDPSYTPYTLHFKPASTIFEPEFGQIMLETEAEAYPMDWTLPVEQPGGVAEAVCAP